MKITLYKMDVTGTVRQWSCEKHGTTVICSWGQMKRTTAGWQEASTLTISQETLADDAAATEKLGSLVRKKRNREGYTTHIPKAVPFLPMLAQNFNGKLFKEFSLQPKLDGFRCIANNTTLRSRQNTIIRSVPHINEALRSLPEGIHLDGELYIHGVDLQTLSSYIKRNTPHVLGHLIEYHVFDIVLLDTPFIERKHQLNNHIESFLFNGASVWNDTKFPIKLVPTTNVAAYGSEDEAMRVIQDFHDISCRGGYEGAIIRNNFGMYEFDKRSPDLLKFKSFVDGEFLIVDVKEGKNRCAIFSCKTPQGDFFDCSPKFTTERKQQVLRYKENYIGKWLEVKYTKLTPDGIPFHPIGLNVFDKVEDKHGP